MNRKQLARLLAACYLVAAVLGVCLGLTRLWGRKACTTQTLAVNEAQWSSMMDHHPVAWAGYDSESLVSTDNDPVAGEWPGARPGNADPFQPAHPGPPGVLHHPGGAGLVR